MALVTDHFTERFHERNPNGNFNHFYACMKRNELALIKTVIAPNGKLDEIYEYNCPITAIEFIAVKRIGDPRGDVWVTFMFKELFIQRQLQLMNSGHSAAATARSRSRNSRHKLKKDRKRRYAD